ncbi:GtrA family protein [Xylella fastidiosa]|uniref:GtrA family protein n=1 Tax=Xylella fastidiosa TaxID=2371 RepID=UPI00041BDC39|nr:GtrA family protein [Xylella fastidiosa]ALQ96416.1 GtrA family protein [Xylella fastidiosa]ALR01305.1 polysaccharide biosynthesis protein GtrA [Xylella fastidiosa]KXB15945.1 polysaccharide biosynthesis protein GtrA [Xylella fastidiosa]KXB22404.1 polysaccharide biosynthesis protein GtrA [Xylella fastidiosa]MDG5823681.1 GtrA family protein [Xylella fastidiosa subsp. pauca]
MPAGSNRNRINSALRDQLLRYLLNGLVATAVHYTILRFNLEVLGLHSAGLANGIAAIFGIIVSFIGNRYFVFRIVIVQVPLAKQVLLFILTYFCIALIHTCILYFWTDVYNLNYTLGFLMATAMQVVFSFFSNKFMVFK